MQVSNEYIKAVQDHIDKLIASTQPAYAAFQTAWKKATADPVMKAYWLQNPNNAEEGSGQTPASYDPKYLSTLSDKPELNELAKILEKNKGKAKQHIELISNKPLYTNEKISAEFNTVISEFIKGAVAAGQKAQSLINETASADQILKLFENPPMYYTNEAFVAEVKKWASGSLDKEQSPTAPSQKTEAPGADKKTPAPSGVVSAQVEQKPATSAGLSSPSKVVSAQTENSQSGQKITTSTSSNTKAVQDLSKSLSQTPEGTKPTESTPTTNVNVNVKSESPVTVKGTDISPQSVLSKEAENSQKPAAATTQNITNNITTGSSVSAITNSKNKTVTPASTVSPKSEPGKIPTPAETAAKAAENATFFNNDDAGLKKDLSNLGDLMKQAGLDKDDSDKKSADVSISKPSAVVSTEQPTASTAKPNATADNLTQSPITPTATGVKVETTSPIKSGEASKILNPPNPVAAGVDKLSKDLGNYSNSIANTVTKSMSQIGGSSSSISNTSSTTNIENTAMPQPQSQASPEEKKAQPETPTQSPGSGLSEYYLHAIYDALVSQGIKIKSL